MEGIYVIPRQALREGDRIWPVNKEGIVRFREVKVLWRRIDEVLVDTDLSPDDRIILSRLQAPVAGMVVRDESRMQGHSLKQKAGEKL